MPDGFRMRNRLAAVTVIATVLVGLWLSGLPADAQGELYRAPRLPGTSHPDLSGIWQAFVTANWNLEDHSAEAGPFPRLLGMWGPRRRARAWSWAGRSRIGRRPSPRVRRTPAPA